MDYTRCSDANLITKRYMDSILIEPRYIDSIKADISVEFFGERFDSPVMMPAFSHLEKDGVNGVKGYIRKTKEELRYLMGSTGFARVCDIDDSVLHRL